MNCLRLSAKPIKTHRQILAQDTAIVKTKKGTTSLNIKEDYDKICGLTIFGNTKQDQNYYFKFNQLVANRPKEVLEKNGLTFSYNGDGSITISGVSTAYTTVSFGSVRYFKGHKYLVKSGINGLFEDVNSGKPFFFLNFGYMKEESVRPVIFTSSKDEVMYNLIYVGVGRDFTEPVTIRPMCIDLTEMYGAGYEPTSYAEFELFFYEDFYPYNQGEYIMVDKTYDGFPFVYTAHVSPSIEIPEKIENSGESTLCFFYPKTGENIMLNGFALAKIGDVCDTLVIKPDSVKRIKRINKIQSYNSEIVNAPYISTTGSLTIGATVYYVMDVPEETDITNTTEGQAFINIIKEKNSLELYVTCEPILESLQVSKIECYYRVIR